MKRIVKHNKKTWGKWNITNPKAELLIDAFRFPHWLIANSYFANILAKKYSAEIKSFSDSKNISYLTKKILKSFNWRETVYPVYDEAILEKQKEYLERAHVKIKTKQDLFDYKIDKIWLGIDIYETYLRGGRPTIDFTDQVFWDTVNDGIGHLLFWNDYFKNHNVAAILLSHDCYIKQDILAKVAYQNLIPVYLCNAIGLFLSKEPHDLYNNRFWNYPTQFRRLTKAEQEEAITWGKQRINTRLSGAGGGEDMQYSEKSAFISCNKDRRILKQSNKLKLIVTTHCFYDNPHGFGGMLFTDFHEWLTFLGEISNQTDYDWYIKPHPDYFPGTLEVISKITKSFPKITLLPPESSFHQLASEGVKYALTCYGSVGHELPLLGIQVINASYNPHSAYDFNYHAKSIEEYRYFLLNLNSLSKAINKNQVYEFYYMHYKYTQLDDLIFPSFKKMLTDISYKNRGDSAVYNYFLDNWSNTKHIEIISKMEEYINSGKKNYYLKGVE
ncbi:MAG TPA: hypothetical protein QF753_05920 [Victivallales bacterium]|nr:hypothetical protein [Victivallales bacterium]